MSQTLYPVAGKVSVFNGEDLIAASSRALTTSAVESNGELLLPASDVRSDSASIKPSSLRSLDGAVLVAIDTTARIEVEDIWPEGGGTTNRFPRWGDMLDLARLMDVQAVGNGRFVAPAYEDIRRNVVEGGQLLGDAMVAASKTLPDKRVVSGHIILSRPAVFNETLDLQVDVHRSGRQFATLGVQTTQRGNPTSSALILMDSGAADLIRGQTKMPDLPGPDASSSFDFGCLGRDVRFVNGDYDGNPDRVGPPELHCWVRHRESPAELYLRQALLGQSTSHYTIAASMLPHKGFGEALAHRTLSTGVLTVTLALHEDVDLTEWLLYTNPSTYAGRGLAQGQGHVFTRDGRLIASFATQAMIRGLEAAKSATALGYSRLM